MAGAYFLHEDNTMDFEIQNHIGLFSLGTNARFNSSQDLDAWAVFVDLGYSVNQKLSLSIGGRFSYEEKDFNNDLIVNVINGGTIPDFDPGLG